ncbi:hypothetical protein [Streptosporangium roseum]|uniref:hypothetical protein n=1 Tax=Streptosporangium roseum TaxID=2001 RepID=UPI0012DC1454|nr:hypothetical protein [Streptosporangium roseum]
MAQAHSDLIPHFYVMRRTIAALLVLSLAGCGQLYLPLGDPLPRPVAVGLSVDGKLQYFAPLCPGEQVASAQVLDHATHRVLWEASNPSESIREGGRITVGASDEFEQVKVPLTSPLPDSLSLELSFAGRGGSGVQADRQSIPSEMSGSDTVLSDTGEKVREADFRARVAQEFC